MTPKAHKERQKAPPARGVLDTGKPIVYSSQRIP